MKIRFRSAFPGPLLFAALLVLGADARAEVKTFEQVYPDISSGALMKARMVKMEKEMLVRSEGIKVKESRIQEIVERSAPKIRDEMRKNRLFILEQEMTRALLLKEAAGSTDIKGLSEMETIQAYLELKFKDVHASPDEVTAYYQENQAMFKDLPLTQVKDAIEQVLTQLKREGAVASHIQGLGGRTDIQVNMEWVETQIPLAKDNPVDKARVSGKPSMVEFGSDGCTPCEMMKPILENLRKNYPEKLNVVFVHIGESPVLGSRFGVRSIPVQAFYDKEGKEYFRHVGFFPEEEVVKKLKEMGVQ